MLALLKSEGDQAFSVDFAKKYTGLEHDRALEFFRTLESGGFICGASVPYRQADTTIDILLPQVLPELSDRRQVILADAGRGFFLGLSGFSESQAEELAAFSSGLTALYDRRQTFLSDEVLLEDSALAFVDPAGHSQLGFWPLHIGSNTLTLIIRGIPDFNGASLRRLVWGLIQRYG